MTTATGHTTAIRAGKAIGTNVFDTTGKKIGEVKDIVLEKTSNNILFAVVSFGGVLGMGEKFHPVPWSELDYDPDRGGYVVSFTAEQLKAAPADSIEALTKGDGTMYRDRAYTHYGTRPYWH
jgi:sporulation protein YlmC with PRC-barrel domain